MSGPRRIDRRGIALLLVLAAVVLVVAVVSGAARIAAIEAARVQRARELRSTDALLPAADHLILTWLEISASDIILDATVNEPRLDILHDAWRTDDLDVEIQITAWDQRGLVPFARLQPGSPWRSLVPGTILTLVDDRRDTGNVLDGLDQFVTFTEDATTVQAFPAEAESRATIFGHDQPVEVAHLPRGIADSADAVGRWISFPQEQDRHLINVHTAPLPLIENALRASGRGGLEVIRAAREHGEAVPAIPSAPHSADRGASIAGRAPVELVSVSDWWAFRIDVSIGRVQRSWWATYRRVPVRNSGRHTPWFCTQRLLITEAMP